MAGTIPMISVTASTRRRSSRRWAQRPSSRRMSPAEAGHYVLTTDEAGGAAFEKRAQPLFGIRTAGNPASRFVEFLERRLIGRRGNATKKALHFADGKRSECGNFRRVHGCGVFEI